MKRREYIQQRLRAILEGIPLELPQIKSVYRNRAALPDDLRPALYLFEGDEANPFPDRGTNRGRGPQKGFQYILQMTPQVGVALESRAPDNTGVGEDLNHILEHVRDQIENDDELMTLLTTNGDIVYNGFVSDLGLGRDMNGMYQVNWTLTYLDTRVE